MAKIDHACNGFAKGEEGKDVGRRLLRQGTLRRSFNPVSRQLALSASVASTVPSINIQS
jgi:hypothetical protein